MRRGHVLETLCNVNQLVIDKTGTLTEGNICLVQTQTFNEYLEEESLRVAAELERFANHPIARAFSAYRSDKPLFNDVENEIGSGLSGA